MEKELEKAFARFPEVPLDSENAFRNLEYNKNGLNLDLHYVLTNEEYKKCSQVDLQAYRCWKPWGEEKGFSARCTDTKYTEVIQAVRAWTHHATLWSSAQLPLFLALSIPMKIELRRAIQTMMFIASVDQPPGLFFLTLYDNSRATTPEISNFTVSVARFLRDALTKFVPGAFPYILPMTFPTQEFSKKRMEESAREMWSDTLPSHSRHPNHRLYCGMGPSRLSPEQLEMIEQAMFFLHSLSDVPNLFWNRNSPLGVYIMDPDLVDAVLLILQYALSEKPGSLKMKCDLNDVKVLCAIFEAAKRLHLCGPTEIIADLSRLTKAMEDFHQWSKVRVMPTKGKCSSASLRLSLCFQAKKMDFIHST